MAARGAAPGVTSSGTAAMSTGGVSSISDAQREKKIYRAFLRLIAGGSRTEQLAAWNAMRAHIMSRSPAQVCRMERRRGLR
jgi:hypothetical protein